MLALSIGLTTLAFADNGGVSRVWVEFNPAGAERAEAVLTGACAEIHYRFDDLNAFSVLVPTAALQGLSRNPNINFIKESRSSG